MNEKQHQANEKNRMGEELTENWNKLQKGGKTMPDYEKLMENLDNIKPIWQQIDDKIKQHCEEYHKADRVKFNPPALEQIKEVGKKYCTGTNFLVVDYEDFRLYWEGQSWKRGKQFINWIPTLYRWIRTSDRNERWKRAKNIDKELAVKEKRLK